MDILGLGTELGKHQAMHAIDFLEILPFPDELHSTSNFEPPNEVTRYDEDLASLKEVSSNLAHFYAATTHILHTQPHIAKQMNCVMSYEITAPVRQVAGKSAAAHVIKVRECQNEDCIVEVANRFGPDSHAFLPIVQM